MSSQPSSEAAGVVAVQQVVAAHAQARATLTDQLVAMVRAMVEGFTGWYDEVAVKRLSRQISDVVQSTQRVMASQEDAYLSRVSSFSGRTFKPVGPVVVSDLRQGVPPEQVYERLAVQMRYERSVGTPEPDALKHVVDRADVMNQMDVALAARSEAEKFFTEHKVKGYRRVLHPELSTGGACGLCIVASDRVYRRDRLLPLHARCKCGVMPLIGDFDAGNSLNNLDLGTLYGDAGSLSRDALKKVRYTVHDHSELGPTLTLAGSGWRSPADVAKATA